MGMFWLGFISAFGFSALLGLALAFVIRTGNKKDGS